MSIEKNIYLIFYITIFLITYQNSSIFIFFNISKFNIRDWELIILLILFVQNKRWIHILKNFFFLPKYCEYKIDLFSNQHQRHKDVAKRGFTFLKVAFPGHPSDFHKGGRGSRLRGAYKSIDHLSVWEHGACTIVAEKRESMRSAPCKFTACGHAACRVENENAATDVNKSEQTGETECRLEIVEAAIMEWRG